MGAPYCTYVTIRGNDPPQHRDVQVNQKAQHNNMSSSSQPSTTHSPSQPIMPSSPQPTISSPSQLPADSPSLQPPAEGVFQSKDELVQACKDHARTQGYAMTIYKTDRKKRLVMVACICYGKPANRRKLTAETRKRLGRGSNKTDCKMHCFGKEQSDGTWLLTIKEAGHNHEAAPLGTYAVHRQRDAATTEKIIKDLWAGCSVQQTFDSLQQEIPGILITKADIRNARKQARLRGLDGQTPS